MKRLNSNSLPVFLDMPGIAVLLVGTDDQATFALAEDFAMLWSDCISEGLGHIRFGHIDDADIPAGRLTLAVGRPTVLVLQDGGVVIGRASRDLHHNLGRVIGLMEDDSTSPFLLAA